jgi:hypothetical protein
VGNVSKLHRLAPHHGNGHQEQTGSRKWLPFSVH